MVDVLALLWGLLLKHSPSFKIHNHQRSHCIVDDCEQGGDWEGAYEALEEFTKAKGMEPVIVHGTLGVIVKPRS